LLYVVAIINIVAAITMSVFSKLPVEQELLSLPEFALGFQ
jgi:Tfp pilus assembly protein FimT